MQIKKKQQGIVLLITIFFIIAISALILQNLKDSEGFFKVVNTNSNLTQTKISIQNVNSEIINFFKKDNNLDEILKQLPMILPLSLSNNINIKINLEEYNPSDYISMDDINSSNLPNDFNENVDYKYTFFEILKNNKKLLPNKKFTSQKQINDIIQQYINETKDSRILNIKDKFSYGSFDNNGSVYLKCNYDLKISNMKSTVNMIFKAKDTNTTQFEFYFK